MILLNNDLIGIGSERSCYIHPHDNTKVIKVFHNKKNKNDQNKLEYKYYQYLGKKNISYKHITRCFGWIDTNMGRGLIFERVVNYDDTAPKQLTHYIKNKIFSNEREMELLLELKKYLLSNNILFMDVATLNILCKKIDKDKYRLIIIDGLGGKRDDFKFYLYTKIALYSRYKIVKQWKRLMFMVERLKLG